MGENNKHRWSAFWKMFFLTGYVLQIVFVVLKAADLVGWKWGAVLVPAYVMVAVPVLSLIVAILVDVVGGLAGETEDD